jgi:uncharacterized protein (DUF1501 family)
MERREFLRLAGAGAAASMVSGVQFVFAQDDPTKTKVARAARPALVAIYLRGGQDALNVVVPHGDKRYYEIRPTIALPAEELVKLDGTFGFHPALKPLKPLWDAGKLAAVVNSGSPHSTRSHFDAQDFMEYGAPGSRTVREGWLNRYLEATKNKSVQERGEEAVALRAVATQPLLPRALRGGHPVLAVPDNNVLANDRVLDSFEKIYGNEEMGQRKEDPVVQVGRETLKTLERYRELVEKRRKERKAVYPAGGLSQRLQDIAGVIHADAGLEIAAVDIGGWDHHANEPAALDRLLKELAGSLAAFVEDLGDRLSQTLVLTMTEFGRTCRENGNVGTDHGHGGCMLLLGGTVKGGRIHGDWRGLDDKALYQARDLPTSTDFRDVFAEVLKSHLAFEPPKGFFPDYTPKGVKELF